MLDDDNWTAAAKPVRDGIADVFRLRDDSPALTWKYDQRKPFKLQDCAMERKGVEIRLTFHEVSQ